MTSQNSSFHCTRLKVKIYLLPVVPLSVSPVSLSVLLRGRLFGLFSTTTALTVPVTTGHHVPGRSRVERSERRVVPGVRIIGSVRLSWRHQEVLVTRESFRTRRRVRRMRRFLQERVTLTNCFGGETEIPTRVHSRGVVRRGQWEEKGTVLTWRGGNGVVGSHRKKTGRVTISPFKWNLGPGELRFWETQRSLDTVLRYKTIQTR